MGSQPIKTINFVQCSIYFQDCLHLTYVRTSEELSNLKILEKLRAANLNLNLLVLIKKRIYYSKIREMRKANGEIKYSNLITLVSVMASFPCSNAPRERIFSSLKLIKNLL